MQEITVNFNFDAGHRIMNHAYACGNYHGHRWYGTLIFDFTKVDELGYAIDFSEIKRRFNGWIKEKLDHTFIANPHDKGIIDLCNKENSNLYLMSVNGKNTFCNPSVELMARELIVTALLLFAEFEPALQVQALELYETPTCSTVVYRNYINRIELINITENLKPQIIDYLECIGKKIYKK
jgi:6-pyruvoyltetrahydropterin/6-carboxytetrahydropterin synthase